MDGLGAGAGSNDLEVPDVGDGSVRAEEPTANSFFWANPPVAAGVVVALPKPPVDGVVLAPNPLVEVCPAGNGAGATVVDAVD